jgi:hypothetical protein
MEIETYPPRKYFFIKEQARSEEYLPENSIPIPTDEEVLAFLGEQPTEEDLPDWLKEQKMKTRWGEILEETGERYSLIFDVLSCSEGILSSQELHLWFLIRKRVPNKELHGYFKVPAIKQSKKDYARQMGLAIRQFNRIFKSLEKKGFIRVEGERGRMNTIWLVDLREVLPLETRKVPPPEKCVRSLIFKSKE